jgi:hypothetical protein
MPAPRRRPEQGYAQAFTAPDVDGSVERARRAVDRARELCAMATERVQQAAVIRQQRVERSPLVAAAATSSTSSRGIFRGQQ